MPTRILRKVNMIGHQGCNVFKNEAGDEIRVKVPVEDYWNITRGVAPIPPIGYSWAFSFQEPKYDTPNGNLGDDEYAVITCAVKLKEEVIPKSVDAHKITNDILTF